MELAQDTGDAGRARRLALIELLDRDGRVLRALDVHQWPVTLGRGLDNDLVLDGAHLAAHHATLAVDAEGTPTLHVGATRNGVHLDGRWLRSGDRQALSAAGATLVLGGQTLRLRLPGETLAEEQAWAPGAPSGWPRLAGLLVALAALAGLETWLDLEPGAGFNAWLPLVLAMGGLLLLWPGAWGLLSKLFRHHFDYRGHLHTALPWLLALTAVGLWWGGVAATLGWTWLWRLEGPVNGLLMLLWVRAHLVQVLPNNGRAVGVGLTLAGLFWAGYVGVTTHRQTDRLFRPAYMGQLPLPGLVLAPAAAPQALVDDLAALATRQAARVQQAQDDGPDEAGGSED